MLISALCLGDFMSSQSHDPKCDQTSSSSARPEFYAQIDAGSILVSGLWEGVETLELVKDYKWASRLLLFILKCPFGLHRRGRVYNRLLIDLKHLKADLEGEGNALAENLDLALYSVCIAAREDPALKDAESIDIKKRSDALLKSIASDFRSSGYLLHPSLYLLSNSTSRNS